jgi:acyl-CoA thioester hydrolase
MIVSELKIRVLYAHTDKMGIVYYGRYFEYFEAGRNEFLRKLGYPYSRIESQNIMLPVIEAQAEYIASAKYDDELTLKTILKSLPTVRIRLEYEIYDGHHQKLAVGFTVHSFVNSKTMKPTRPPAEFMALIKSKM